MRKEDTIRLNTHFVARRVETLGLKQWWLAERVGVTAKTVGRWLSGKSERVSRENAERLAQHLECEFAAVVLSDETDVHATREQQRRAARLIEQQDLVALLSPTDNWRLAESLIKATLEPNLPLRRLGMLYNLLSITAWRQGNYTEGLAHAERARRLGLQCGDRGVVHKALFNIATIRGIIGPHTEALAAFEETLREPEYFDTERDHASALSNIACTYGDFGRFDEGIAAQRRAIAIYEKLRLPYNLAIAWTSMLCVMTELGRFGEARRAADRVARYAAAAGYERGEASLLVRRADLLSLLGRHDEALRLAHEGRARLTAFEVYDLGCNVAAVRVERRAGRTECARELLESAEPLARPIPVLYAEHLLERARLETAEGDEAAARRAVAAANRVYRGAGIDARLQAFPVGEHGAMFARAEPSAPHHADGSVRQKIRTFNVPVR